MYLMHAADREEIKEAFAGDIVALQGLKDTRTGETLCDPQKPVILEKMDFPEPVIEMKVEPKTKADTGKDGDRAPHSGARRPLLPRVGSTRNLVRRFSRAMGELHLDIKVDILKRTYGVEANTGAPQVAYRETLHVRLTSITRTRSRRAARASSHASS